jgi:hypothetical protein
MTGPYDKKWNMQHEKLVEYKRKTGDCVVPQSYKVDKSLGVWVNKQRVYHKNNKLRLDRKERLDEIGFAWKVDSTAARVSGEDKKWDQQYEKLVQFKRKREHCIVPNRHEQDKSLGIWVDTQRTIYRKNELRQDRKRLLNEIGFVWKNNDTLWDQRYEKLVEFKRINGNCMVPRRYKQDKSLGAWVGTQRTDHKNNKMRPDRKRILDEIGFAWKAVALAARSSTTNVRNLVIGSFHALGGCHVSNSPSFPAYLCVANGFGSQPIRRTRREYGASARAR